MLSESMAEAKKFYGEVFGWSVEDQDTGGGPPYAIFTNDRHQVAGLGQMSDEMKAQGIPPHWSNYVNVDDAEAVAARLACLMNDAPTRLRMGEAAYADAKVRFTMEARTRAWARHAGILYQLVSQNPADFKD